MKNEEISVGLTYDLRDDYLAEGYSEIDTAEFDRADTIDSIDVTLTKLGYKVDRIGNVKALAARLVKGDTWDIVFNICEGLHGIGREAQVPALLDAYEIPHVFSDALVCALTLHKGMTKDVVRAAGVATPDYAVVHDLSDIANITLPLPLFAKPIAEGTGKGISAQSKINSLAELRKICRKLLGEHKGQPVLVERFLPGREFTVGIIGTGRKARALATMEIVLLENADAEVYSYRNKEECEELVQYQLLGAGQLRQQVESLAVQSWQALGCRDAGRIDIRLDESGQPQFIEVNPLAGIHPEHSDLPIMAAKKGVSYHVLIGRIMSSAMQRIGQVAKAESVAA
ncbi:MAG TPA: ATP-grasp domain-containing protein [Woeseiaceae bacterium]|nr:ATP-grasp domain-containing protein [Woeseiaceae bacterium]